MALVLLGYDAKWVYGDVWRELERQHKKGEKDEQGLRPFRETMSHKKMEMFIRRLECPKLIEEIGDRPMVGSFMRRWSGGPRFLKAVRVMLYEIGYDVGWVENVSAEKCEKMKRFHRRTETMFKHSKGYLEYVNSGEASAVWFVRLHLAAARGHWIDVREAICVNPDDEERYDFHGVSEEPRFCHVLVGLFRRKKFPRWPRRKASESDCDYHERCAEIAWETARDDIEAQKRRGFGGKPWRIFLKKSDDPIVGRRDGCVGSIDRDGISSAWKDIVRNGSDRGGAGARLLGPCSERTDFHRAPPEYIVARAGHGNRRI